MRHGSRPLRSLILLFLLLGSAAAARAQETPLIQVDTGGHTSIIRSLAFTPDGNTLASAGYDKVVRIWSIATGLTDRVLRGQISDGREGEIHAMALSPDGSRLAVAGYMSSTCPGNGCGDIRLFDLNTGQLIGLASGHGNIVLSLAFSADGRRFASASADGTTKVWDAAQRRASASFPAPEGWAMRVAFVGGDHVATASSGGSVHVFGLREGSLVRTLATTGVNNAIAVSDDGRLIAAGGSDGGVRIWSWPSGETYRELAGNGARIGSLAFGHGPSAKHLVSTPLSAPYVSRLWDVTASTLLAGYPGHTNVTVAAVFSPDGSRVATAGLSDQAIHVWSPSDPASVRVLAGQGTTVWAAGFLQEEPADATSAQRARELLAWGYSDPCPGVASCPDANGKLEFALRLPDANDGTLGKPEAWPRPAASAPAAKTVHRVRQAVTTSSAGTLKREPAADPRRFPKLLLERPGERREIAVRGVDRGSDHVSYSFDPEHQWVVSGGHNGTLEVFDLGGTRLANLVGHSGDVWSVAVSSRGRLIVSGSTDQTVRLWNAKTGELVASMLHLRNGEWIIWTPQGYFTASPGGEKLVGWHINRGRERAAEHVSAQQLREHFLRPDIVSRAIAMASAIDGVREARHTDRLTPFRIDDVVTRAPPRFSLLSPQPSANVNGGRVAVTLAKEFTSSEIKEYTVYVNDTRIDKIEPVAAGPGGEISFDVPLYGGRNVIRIVARNGDNLLSEQWVRVIHDGEGALDRRGTLYVVAIGVDKYPRCGSPKCNLDFAGADAKAFEASLRARMGVGKGHQQVESRVLVNGAGGKLEPTRTNIEDALDLFIKAKEQDTSVLFIAGHGTNVDPRGYLFLPTDAEPGDSGWKSSTVVRWINIEAAIHGSKGRRLLFVDTCRSANAYGARIVNDAVHSQIVVYTATRQQQDALEKATIGHGFFTFALLEGLVGKADLNGDKMLKVGELGWYVKDLVSRLTDGEQEPDYYKPLSTDDFTLARF